MSVTLRQTVALGISNVHEREALRWSRYPAQLAITGLHELSGPLDRCAAATDFHENADEISHHMMEKGVGSKLEREETPLVADTNRQKSAHWRA